MEMTIQMRKYLDIRGYFARKRDEINRREIAAMMGWENAFHCEINPFGRALLE